MNFFRLTFSTISWQTKLIFCCSLENTNLNKFKYFLWSCFINKDSTYLGQMLTIIFSNPTQKITIEKSIKRPTLRTFIVTLFSVSTLSMDDVKCGMII